jgi:subfamily B ATP-binding cassette protein MsbA
VKDLLRIFKYIKPYWAYAILNIVSNILYILFSFFNLTLFIPFVNILFGNAKPIAVKPELSLNTENLLNYLSYFIDKMIAENGKLNAMLLVSILFVLFSILNNFFKYSGMYFLAPIRNGMIKDLRNDIYNRILILPLSFYSTQKKGDLMSRLTSDINEIEWSIVSTLQMAIKDPLNVLFFVIILFSISPQLMLLSLVTLIPAGLLINKIGKSLKRNSEKGQKQMGLVVSTIEESINGLRIIKAFNAIDYASLKFKKTNYILFSYMTKIYRRRDAAAPLTESLAIIGLVLIIWFGGNLVLNNKLTASVLLFFIVVFARLIPPAQSFISSFYNLQKGQAAAKRVMEIIDAKEVIIEKENAIAKQTFEKCIQYNDVSFQYNEQNTNNYVLKNISFKIEKGKTVAIVGHSGAGKSTLADLLPRFYNCTSGEITIDNIPINDLIISDLRGLIGIVSQETILFNDTIFNNIAFGKENVKLEEVIAAAKIANAHEFIEKMGNGYFSNIGDKGANLSGGQRQRISIARAVLKNPPIMILDEATSALDTKSELYVQDALTNLMKSRTSIIIAHRLSTIKNADEILVIENGEIIENGKHDQLILKNGVYKTLVQNQSFNN